MHALFALIAILLSAAALASDQPNCERLFQSILLQMDSGLVNRAQLALRSGRKLQPKFAGKSFTQALEEPEVKTALLEAQKRGVTKGEALQDLVIGIMYPDPKAPLPESILVHMDSGLVSRAQLALEGGRKLRPKFVGKPIPQALEDPEVKTALLAAQQRGVTRGEALQDLVIGIMYPDPKAPLPESILIHMDSGLVSRAGLALKSGRKLWPKFEGKSHVQILEDPDVKAALIGAQARGVSRGEDFQDIVIDAVFTAR
ncbi:MAG: hypothetical protein NDJ90_08295 [Oligoflexia bacterium]|nr:hypothetical protein [Oligoflexia bacterium]